MTKSGKVALERFAQELADGIDARILAFVDAPLPESVRDHVEGSLMLMTTEEIKTAAVEAIRADGNPNVAGYVGDPHQLMESETGGRVVVAVHSDEYATRLTVFSGAFPHLFYKSVVLSPIAQANEVAIVAVTMSRMVLGSLASKAT